MPSAQKQNLQAFVAGLNELRKEGKQCDVVFDIGRKSFMAHRNVLTARVKLFNKKFSTNIRKKRALHVPLDPSIIDPEVFEQILQYIYTWNIDISEENVESIYRAAKYFRFYELCDKVIEFVKANIGIKNVDRYLAFAAKLNIEKVIHASRKFIVTHFPFEIGAKKLISSLSNKDLRMLFNEMRNRNRYEDMYHYGIEWILQDEGSRCEKMMDLLKSIPINRLSMDFLKHIVGQNRLVTGDEQCSKLLADVLAHKPQDDILYLLGGSQLAIHQPPCSKLCRFSVSKFDSFTNEWSLSSPLQKKQCSFTCTVIDKKIFICGGHYDQVPGEVRQFDTTTNEWTTLKHMTRQIVGSAMAALNGCLYIVGGIDNWMNEHVRRVERYSIQDDKLENVCPMNEARSSLQLVEMNGFLYAIGGITTSPNSVERYDPQTNEWRLMGRPGTISTDNKYVVSSAVLHDRIYTVYSTFDDEWSEMPGEGIPQSRYGTQLAAVNGQLLALGGISMNFKAYKSVYRFDFEQGRWIAEKDMNVGRGLAGVAVVKF